MKNWIIEKNGDYYTYLIVSEKSVWISTNYKESNIDQLIKNRNLGTVKSFRFDQLKEIIFIETNSSIEFSFKEKERDKESFLIDRIVFGEIRSYLKLKLAGIKMKNYSLLKQVIPQLSTLGFGSLFLLLTYQTAVDLENGVEITEYQKSSIIKRAVLHLAELIGVTGTIILGVAFALILIFLINKKLQNPKKGEVMIFGKYVYLKK